MTKMCTYFKTKTDVAQYLSTNFSLTLPVTLPFHRKYFKRKKIWEYGVKF